MVKQAEKKKKQSPLMPVIGLFLAIIFGLFAVVLIGPASQFLLDQRVSFGTMDVNLRNGLIGGMLWLIMFGSAMFLVSILVGRDPDEKENIEFLKRTEQTRKQRERERKRRR